MLKNGHPMPRRKFAHETAASRRYADGECQSAEPIAADKTPPKLTLSDSAILKFYGDVEFNMDAASRSGN